MGNGFRKERKARVPPIPMLSRQTHKRGEGKGEKKNGPRPSQNRRRIPIPGPSPDTLGVFNMDDENEIRKEKRNKKS